MDSDMDMNSLKHIMELNWKLYKTKREGNEGEDREDCNVVAGGKALTNA